MPTIDKFLKESDRLLTDIHVFQSQPDLVNPYRVINGLSEILKVASGIILPQTQALKLVTIGIKLFAAFLNGYSDRKKE